MSFRIGKRFSFDAAHCLPSLPADHKCSRLHGHTYTVEVVLSAATLTSPGFVTDFRELRPLRHYLGTTLDHEHLNKVLDIEPTAENLARHIAEWFIENVEPTVPASLEIVRVYESPTSWGEYEVERP